MNVGAQLRQAREDRGLTVVGVASTTRIQPRMLEAIERNDLSGLPPRIYARGFVAAYAREVQLDPTETVDSYFAQFDDTPVEEPPPRPVPPQDYVSDEWRAWMPALSVLLLFALGSGLVMWRSSGARERESGAVGTSGTPAAASDARPAATPHAPTDAVVPALREGQAPRDHARATPASTSSDLVVTLEADRPSWIAATTDDQRALYRIVPAGSKETLRASREIKIRVGDAGAIRWSVNGRNAVPMGLDGEVRNATVKSDNVTNTGSPAPAPLRPQ